MAYVHPLVASAALVLSVFVLNLGLKQRDQRRGKGSAPSGNLARHLALGPWVVALCWVAVVGGVGTAVVVRGFAPMGTLHAWAGLFCAVGFTGVWWLGRAQLGARQRDATRHGLVALLAVFLGGIAALLGIELLP